MSLIVLKVRIPASRANELAYLARRISAHLDHPGDPLDADRVAAWIIGRALTDHRLRARCRELLQDAGALPAEEEY